MTATFVNYLSLFPLHVRPRTRIQSTNIEKKMIFKKFSLILLCKKQLYV